MPSPGGQTQRQRATTCKAASCTAPAVAQSTPPAFSPSSRDTAYPRRECALEGKGTYGYATIESSTGPRSNNFESARVNALMWKSDPGLLTYCSFHHGGRPTIEVSWTAHIKVPGYGTRDGIDVANLLAQLERLRQHTGPNIFPGGPRKQPLEMASFDPNSCSCIHYAGATERWAMANRDVCPPKGSPSSTTNSDCVKHSGQGGQT
ncbi:hypothetical protein B0H63DRAFT_560872 [Podospora didyma]|uniref:Uncharacterized protein n=1 Tax=Podospora didyma TaxID=330526 RepID=A0AAE0NGI1_9PEZI|nr:hypothetical protein B0H63DRAFT_560872 [Podospora didyma]